MLFLWCVHVLAALVENQAGYFALGVLNKVDFSIDDDGKKLVSDSAKSGILPCSTSRRAAMAAKGLLMEPAWNMVSAVTGWPPRLVTP
ncbi:MAG: hypothetical protein ABSE46_15560 [Terracidiphilus sp.]